MKPILTVLVVALLLLIPACNTADSEESMTLAISNYEDEMISEIPNTDTDLSQNRAESTDDFWEEPVERSESETEAAPIDEELSQTDAPAEAESGLKTVEAEGFYIDVPSDWQKNRYNGVTAWELDGRTFGFHTIMKPESGEMSSLKDYYDTFIEHGNIVNVAAFYDTVGSYNRLHMKYEGTGSGAGYTFEMMLIDVGDRMVMFNTQYNNAEDGELLNRILSSIRPEV